MAQKTLITTQELATKIGKSPRWVQRAVAQEKLTVAETTKGPGDCDMFLFDPVAAARQLAETVPDKFDGLAEQTQVFILGLVRGDETLAQAMYSVICGDLPVADTARLVNLNPHMLARQVRRYAEDVRGFVARRAGLETEIETEPETELEAEPETPVEVVT